MIAADHGISIQQIFDYYGETYFRSSEREVISKHVAGPRVIAIGGGAFSDEQTRQLLNARALTIWLDVSLALLSKRTAGTRERPLLVANRRKGLGTLLKKRRSEFHEADVHLRCKSLTLPEIVGQVLEAVRRELDKPR